MLEASWNFIGYNVRRQVINKGKKKAWWTKNLWENVSTLAASNAAGDDHTGIWKTIPGQGDDQIRIPLI